MRVIERTISWHLNEGSIDKFVPHREVLNKVQFGCFKKHSCEPSSDLDDVRWIIWMRFSGNVALSFLFEFFEGTPEHKNNTNGIQRCSKVVQYCMSSS